MHTLIIELDGPMQSWGYRSRFSMRDTGREPTKSGVIGIIAACMGKVRDEDVSDLALLRFGVRADREGIAMKEFQTARNIRRAQGGIADTQTSTRYYLAGARFIAGLEGELPFLEQIRGALLSPVFIPFLGRRSYVPASPLINPLHESIFPLPLAEALRKYPYSGKERNGTAPLRIVRDAMPDEESPTQDFRQDVPVSFGAKEYYVRKVITEWIEVQAMREVEYVPE